MNMHVYDYSFLRRSKVDTGLLSRVSNIERIDVAMDSSRKEDEGLMGALEARAKIMSIADSNAIEGIYTDDIRLLGIVSGRTAPRGHDEEEIAGYRDALALIHRDHDRIDLNIDFILELYSILMKYNANIRLGFKTKDNAVVEKDSKGNIVKVHQTVPASEATYNMEQLILAFNDARNDADINNLLLIPCFISDFLMIHPFLDGNGRMSRLLTTLLLYQEGYEICRYISMESMINLSKNDYYDALERSHDGWFDNKNDNGPFISYFISQMFLCYREMDFAMATETGKRRKSDGLEWFLERTFMPVSKKDLCGLFTGLSETTIERVLGKMVSDGRIERIGANKNSRYMAVRKHHTG